MPNRTDNESTNKSNTVLSATDMKQRMTLCIHRLYAHLGPQAAVSLRSVPAWRWWYIGPVVMSNVGDNSVSSCRLHASETQQLSYIPMADVTPSVFCVELLWSSRQPMTGRLATHPSNTTVKIQIYYPCSGSVNAGSVDGPFMRVLRATNSIDMPIGNDILPKFLIHVIDTTIF